MIGLSLNIPSENLIGLTLELRVNGGSIQVITFTGNGLISDINAQATSLRAYPSANVGVSFILVRNTLREAPGALSILGGTALSVLGLTPHDITQGSEYQLLATVTDLTPGDDMYEYSDPDGSLSDLYALTTLDSQGNESEKTAPRRASDFTGKVCVIEGLVHNIQGVRVPDVMVTVKPMAYAQSPSKSAYYTMEEVTVYSDPSGRFSIPLIQGARVQIDIPDLSFSKVIVVPATAYEFITTLPSDYDFRFASEGQGV
jgi:hypothetical protein